MAARREDSKPRRAAGEGGLSRRSDGRWVGTFDLGWEWSERLRRNVRRRKYVYGKTQREVLQKLASVRRQVEQGLAPPPERMTVESFLADWLKAAEPGLRPSTYHRYQEVVRVHLVPGLGRHKLAQLAPKHVDDFLRKKAAEPRPRAGRGSERLSPRTIQEIRTILVIALNQGMRWGLVVRNAAALVEGPRVPHHEIRPFTPEQARRFFEAFEGHRMEALYSVAIAVGLRQGEALGLTWDDIDFDEGLLHVRRALQRIEGRYELVETKTARSRRTIALPAFALAALRRHKARQNEERLAAGRRWQDRNFVFCTPFGYPLHGPTVTREFQALLERAELPRQRFHDLRHACASLLLAQGVDLKVIQETLGHSTIAVTANVYSHVMSELKRDAAARMDAVFAPQERGVAN